MFLCALSSHLQESARASVCSGAVLDSAALLSGSVKRNSVQAERVDVLASSNALHSSTTGLPITVDGHLTPGAHRHSACSRFNVALETHVSVLSTQQDMERDLALLGAWAPEDADGAQVLSVLHAIGTCQHDASVTAMEDPVTKAKVCTLML